jgi:NADPH:quinone reductase-like Zn-dependent oxidoreductase
MKAIVFDRYGPADVLHLKDIQMPTARDDEVLVRIRAAGVNPYDWRVMRADPHLVRLSRGLRRPRGGTVLGSDIAGQVEAIGKNVTRFHPGDEVFTEVDTGGFRRVRRVQGNLAGAEAGQPDVRAGGRCANDRLDGPAGPARSRTDPGWPDGPDQRSFRWHRYVRRAARQVVRRGGYRRVQHEEPGNGPFEDFASGAQRYDLVLDTVGNRSLSELRRSLVPKGTLVITGGGGGRWLGPATQVIKAMALSPFVSQRLVAVLGTPNSKDLGVLKGLIEAGAITPVIDRTHPLREVPDAIRYVETRHARGKVVITV